MPYDDSDVKKMIKYQTERKVGFSRQKKISQDVKDLIHSILEANVERRYTIQDIKYSVWMMIVPPAAPPSQQQQQQQQQRQAPATEAPTSDFVVQSPNAADADEQRVVATPADNSNGASGTVRPETPLRMSNLLPLSAFHDANGNAANNTDQLQGAVGYTPVANSRLDVERGGLKRSSLIVDAVSASARDRVRCHGR
jgi:hypothetical protein